MVPRFRAVYGVLLVVLSASAADGVTVTVRKDGTGDFSVIQLALNAVAGGDTILIGPGEYTDRISVRLPGATEDIYSYGEIRVPSLTIIGAGMGATVIGPASYEWTYTGNPQGLTMTIMDHELHISDLTIRNCFSGLYFRGSLDARRCELRNNDDGISAALVGATNSIRDCRFSGDIPNPIGIYTRGTDSNLVVEGCDSDGAMAYISNANAILRQCSIVGSNLGVEVFNGASCQIWGCDISGVSIGVKTYVGWPGSHCEIHNSRITGSIAALLVDQRTSATVENSVLTGGSNSVVLAQDSEALTIHGCDFLKGSGPIVRCSRPSVWGAVTYDLTNNYWGTTDEIQVQDWIIDSGDDASIYATVLYSPFAGQSVPTESTTWGDLKALFR
jgi:hypothetical protein